MKSKDPRAEAYDINYERRLVKNRDGETSAIIKNIYLVLMHDEAWTGVIALDEFSYRVMKLKAPPFTGGHTGEWTDTDNTFTAMWLVDKGLKVTSAQVNEAVDACAQSRAYHPVKAYLESLEWDRTERLRCWLSAWLGAGRWANQDNDHYLMQSGMMWLVSAVARI